MPKRKIGKKTRLNKQRQNEKDQDPFIAKQPHSMIIGRGKIGKNTNNLINNFKKVMEPFTASNLKVQKSNSLKDFISICPTLNLTHIAVFNKTDTMMNLRILRVPRGPTLWFNVVEYVLAKDVLSTIRRPISDQHIFRDSALCVMNNFNNQKRHSKLAKDFIQAMFPTTNIPTLKLEKIRRVVIWQWDDETETIDFRQYVISVQPIGCSKKIKNLLQAATSLTKNLPNVGKCEDISEFLKEEADQDIKNENDNSNVEVKIESEIDQSDNDVKIKTETDDDGFNDNVTKLAQNVKKRGGNLENEKSKIILTECGPRMKLCLVKIQQGVNDGEVLYHKYETKTESEVLKLGQEKTVKLELKKKRRLEQEANVRKKKKKIAEDRMKKEKMKQQDEE